MKGDLYCTRCHTKWTESCLQIDAACPFKDCDGKLSGTPPVGSIPVPRPKVKPTYPLLAALDE
jgi:hypothetical protein